MNIIYKKGRGFYLDWFSGAPQKIIIPTRLHRKFKQEIFFSKSITTKVFPVPRTKKILVMNAMISEFLNRLYTPSIKGDWLSLFVGKTKEDFFFPEGVLTILYTICRNCSGQEKNFPPKNSMYPYTVVHQENQRRQFFLSRRFTTNVVHFT